MNSSLHTFVLALTLTASAISLPAFAGAPSTPAAKSPVVAAAVTGHISGTLVTVDPQLRVVKLRMGKAGTEETFHLAPSATVLRGKKTITLDALKVGEQVSATKNGDQLASLSVRGK